MSKYYGLQPGEIEEMPLRKFHEYLRQIPSVRNILNGGEPTTPGYEQARGGEDARDILRRHGLAVPGE